MKDIKTVLIVDAFSAAHVGNGALLKSSMAVIRHAWPNAKIEVLAQRQDTICYITNIDYSRSLFQNIPVHQAVVCKLSWLMVNIPFVLLQWLNQKTLKLSPSRLAVAEYRKNALKTIDRADVIVSITGEAINDAFRKTLPFHLFTYWLASNIGKKVIIFPQSIGPLKRRWTKFLVRRVLSQCTLVAARDEFSVQLLKTLNLPQERFCFTPDVATTQSYIGNKEAHSLLKSFGVTFEKRRLIGLTASNVTTDEGISNKDCLSILIEVFREILFMGDTELLLMPTNMPFDNCSDQDYAACMTIYEQLKDFGGVYILDKRVYSPEQFKGMQALMGAVVSTRMHAAILSTMALTPTITINTQFKLKGYMMNVGQQDFSIDMDRLCAPLLKEIIESALASHFDISQTLEIARQRMVNQVDAFVQRLRVLN